VKEKIEEELERFSSSQVPPPGLSNSFFRFNVGVATSVAHPAPRSGLAKEAFEPGISPSPLIAFHLWSEDLIQQ
jgi:hypothetical protein